MLDRTLPPVVAPLKSLSLPAYRQLTLSNGIPVYLLPYGQNEVVEIQALFQAGYCYEPTTGIAEFTAQTMREGTASYDSLALAQALDSHGAWLGEEVDDECLALTLSTISSRIAETLPLLQEVIIAPTFPEEEFTVLKANTLQKMAVDAQKTATQARRHFGSKMFGAGHPYGRHFGVPELERIQLAELVQYHQSHLGLGQMQLTVVGRYEETTLMALLEQYFGGLARQPGTDRSSAAINHPFTPAQGRHYIAQAGMQASLILGHEAMAFSHPDYYGMSVVNTILGGYFGSRLMHNIREKKGYTYGIYSLWKGRKHGGHLEIRADVANEYVAPTIAEVKKEMQALRDQGVRQAELNLVCNYLLGRSISQRETPFQMSDLLRFSLSNDISFAEIDRQFEVIQQIQAERIQALAQQYLLPDQLLEVVVGQL